jgi:hypothetical protein
MKRREYFLKSVDAVAIIGLKANGSGCEFRTTLRSDTII